MPILRSIVRLHTYSIQLSSASIRCHCYLFGNVYQKNHISNSYKLTQKKKERSTLFGFAFFVLYVISVLLYYIQSIASASAMIYANTDGFNPLFLLLLLSLTLSHSFCVYIFQSTFIFFRWGGTIRVTNNFRWGFFPGH